MITRALARPSVTVATTVWSSRAYASRRPMSMPAGIARTVWRSTFAANERTLELTETPPQGGRAFNPTQLSRSEPIRASVARTETRRAKGIVMDMPEILRGDSPVRLFQGAVAGAALSMAIGFGWAGWTLGGTVAKMVEESGRTAVITALAPISVDKFQHASNATENLAELRKTASYQQGTFVEKGGWATLPGSDASNYAVAQACANMLTTLK
jgi:hypothetical protein